MILFLIAFLFVIGLSAQNSAYERPIYRDYGTFKITDGRNVVSVSAFVTIEKVDPLTHVDDVDNNALQMQKTQKMQKNAVIEPKILYHYEVYLVSKSIFEGDTTSTWLYGTKIFINGEDVLINQFPDGFVVSIRTVPTSIYTYHSTKSDAEFEIKWEKAIYEPRIRK